LGDARELVLSVTRRSNSGKSNQKGVKDKELFKKGFLVGCAETKSSGGFSSHKVRENCGTVNRA